jgi:hypothetical protein
MKYLDEEKLTEVSHQLVDVVCGTRVINGRIEAYSCKRAGTDKKYAQTLAERYETEVSSSNNAPFETSSYASGNLGDFHETSTRRLLTDLILTLNASFPDYDFSEVRPANFRCLSSPKVAISRVNERLSDLAFRRGPTFLSYLWKAIDDVIDLGDCKVFAFYPEGEGADPFASPTRRYRSESLGSIVDDHEVEPELGATLWAFNYLFVNKQLKRIVLFSCCQSCLVEDSLSTDEELMSTPGAFIENRALYAASPSADEDEEGTTTEVVDVAQPAISLHMS